jgi:hypothetical protein
MNTGRLSLICWVLFLVALIAAIPLVQISGPAAVACGVVSVLSFVYAMYIGLWAMRKGDPWLVRRGVSGTAEVVAAKETSWTMAAGEYYGIGAPSVWKYGLEVTVPGRSPYRTTLYICARLHEGDTLPVRVSRLNHERVTVDGPALASEGGGTTSRSARREQAFRDALTDSGDR